MFYLQQAELYQNKFTILVTLQCFVGKKPAKWVCCYRGSAKLTHDIAVRQLELPESDSFDTLLPIDRANRHRKQSAFGISTPGTVQAFFH